MPMLLYYMLSLFQEQDAQSWNIDSINTATNQELIDDEDLGKIFIIILKRSFLKSTAF